MMSFLVVLWPFFGMGKRCSTWNIMLSAKLDEQNSEIGLGYAADLGCLSEGGGLLKGEFLASLGAQGL
jgi:hypothetical protein